MRNGLRDQQETTGTSELGCARSCWPGRYQAAAQCCEAPWSSGDSSSRFPPKTQLSPRRFHVGAAPSIGEGSKKIEKHQRERVSTGGPNIPGCCLNVVFGQKNMFLC